MARRYKKIQSTIEDRAHVERAVRWSNKAGTFAGLIYFDEIVSSAGIYLELMATEETPEEQIQKALREAYSERDVVSHAVRICPKGWLES